MMSWGIVLELNELKYGLGIEVKDWDSKWEQLYEFCN